MLLLSLQGLAQHNKIYDVFSNASYSYQNKYKEVKAADLNLAEEIDIHYFALRNEGYNYDRLNAFVEKLALNSWQNDKSKFDLESKVKEHVARYNKFKNSKNNSSYRTIENRMGSIELKSIEVELVSICNEVITFNQTFQFHVISNKEYYNSNGLEVNITQYYTSSIFNQTATLFNTIFNEKQLERLQKTLGPYVDDFSNELKAQFTDEDRASLNETLNEEIEEEEPKRQETEDDNDPPHKPIANVKKIKNEKIDFSEAIFYWYAWGLMVEFPEYSMSSTLTNGLTFRVFVPLTQCKEILDLFPAYHNFAGISKPAHQFKNFDYFDVVGNYNKFRSEPKVTSLFTLNKVLEKPKNLTIGSYQTFKDNKKTHRGNFIYNFDVNAANFQKSAEKTDYTAFMENYNGKLKAQKRNANSKNNNNKYDERGNLLIRKFDDIESGDFVFFYNDMQCFYFRLRNLNEKAHDEFYKLSMNNAEICLIDVCLKINANMQVTAVKALRNQQTDTQLGFDAKDRLVEAHTENDRYNYYYEYDESDRLIKYSYYEYTRLEKEVDFIYLENNRLPYLQKKHTVAHDTFEEETYEWEY